MPSHGSVVVTLLRTKNHTLMVASGTSAPMMLPTQCYTLVLVVSGVPEVRTPRSDQRREQFSFVRRNFRRIGRPCAKLVLTSLYLFVRLKPSARRPEQTGSPRSIGFHTAHVGNVPLSVRRHSMVLLQRTTLEEPTARDDRDDHQLRRPRPSWPLLVAPEMQRPAVRGITVFRT